MRRTGFSLSGFDFCRISKKADRLKPVLPLANYFRSAAIFAMPALAQASSLSPPGAPLTPTAPITTLPALIGTPPAVPVVPSMFGAGGFSAQALPVSAVVLLKVSAEYAYFREKSIVWGAAPSSRKNALSRPSSSITVTVT